MLLLPKIAPKNKPSIFDFQKSVKRSRGFPYKLISDFPSPILIAFSEGFH
jgi:hypothetical protein